MSKSRPIINPYYSKWDTPKLQNRFQKAVFNGRTTKVRDLIISGENVYNNTTDGADESPLFISIVRDHKAIVNQILDVYEDDLHFVRNFFRKKHNVDWNERPVFIAHGSDNICLVNQLSTGMEVLTDDHCIDETQTMVIMLKSLQEKKVLCLRPNSSEDNVKIAKIIECIWNDGVIDLQHKGHWGRTVFDAAALRNQPDIYCRLYRLSIAVPPEKSIEHFLQLSRHYDDQLEFFKDIQNKTGQQFDIADIISKNVDLIALPVYYDQFEIFMLFLEAVADKIGAGENRQVVMTNILNTHKIRDSTLMETIVWADQKKFLHQCLIQFKPNLLLIGSNKETVLQSIIRQKSSELLTRFIVECFDQVLTNGMEVQILMQLIESNWLDAVKTLYGRYESSRKVLFRNKKQGVQCLLNAIDGCRYDLVNYLVDAHQEELTDPHDVTHLILYCSFVERSNAVLRTLLTLPAADPLRTSGPEHYYKSPIYVALKFRHLENFQFLLDNVKNVQGLSDVKEDNGENLLFPAIWFKENPVDETPFVYVEEEQVSLEIVDSSDDEDESSRKRARNKEILTSSGPYKDPIMADSYFENESMEMNRIFNYFLNDLSFDYQCVNNIGETLLHVAVKQDNFDAVNQLLALGLDPNVKDVNGNYAIHGVRSLAILNLLRHFQCDINASNLSGETPLLSYVKVVVDGADDETLELQKTFLIELVKAGADINHTDANGLTALHLVQNVHIAQILLEHGSPVNAKNNEGEAPILYIFRELPLAQSLFKLFLCNEAVDIMTVSENNVSVLSVLVSLDDVTMSEVLSSFSKRSRFNSELDDLFIQHCNSLDYSGRPVIVTACSEHTNSYCLNKLLNLSQLDPNVYPDYSPLEASENKDTIERLIERGANVNGVGDAKTKTPLMHAIGGRNLGGYKSNFETFAVLLAAGADVNAIDANGDSALDYACRLENLTDARRSIAALILAKVDYYQEASDNKLPLSKIMPFQCFYVD